MNRITTIIFIAFLVSSVSWAQNKNLIITGGYAWANLEEADVSATGFRINATYELTPNSGKLSHGLSIGYIGTSAESDGVFGAEYNLNNWPLYYAPKFTFGNGKAKAFVKGALGMHFSNYKRTVEASEVTTTDGGFYGGIGFGGTIDIKDNLFIIGEYEWAYMSNSFYQDGFMNTANFGLGFRF